MTGRSEVTFQERCEIIAQRLEAKAKEVRRITLEDYPATERAAEIVAECDGVGAHSLKLLIKWAVKADEK